MAVWSASWCVCLTPYPRLPISPALFLSGGPGRIFIMALCTGLWLLLLCFLLGDSTLFWIQPTFCCILLVEGPVTFLLTPLP